MRRYLCLVALGAAALIALVPSAAAWAADPAGSSPTPAATPAPVGEPCERVDRPFDPEDIRLTGAWGDIDGGISYIRQMGPQVSLMRMSDRMLPPASLGREWSVVGMGTLGDDLTITLDWTTVPRGNYLPGGGTVTLQVGADGAGNLRITTVGDSGDFGDPTLWPCAPATRVSRAFSRPFEFRDEPGIGLTLFDFAPVVVAIHPGYSAEDFWVQGITVWRIDEDSAWSCEGPGPTLEPGSAAFLDWLRSRSDLVVSEDTPVSIDGHPATSVEVTVAPGAATCVEGELPTSEPELRLAQISGMDMKIEPGNTTRLIAFDLDGDTIVFELWGPHSDVWLPLAQRVVDTVHFVE